MIEPVLVGGEGGKVKPVNRLRWLIAAGCCLLAGVSLAAPRKLVVLGLGGRQELLPVVRDGAELLPIGRLIAGLQVARRHDRQAGHLILTRGEHEVTLYDGKSLAAVDGDLKLLSGKVAREAQSWLIPIDAAARLLPPLLGVPVEWRASARVLTVGDIDVPRVDVSTEAKGGSVRVTFSASEPLPFDVLDEADHVTVSVPRDLIDAGFVAERLTGGIVDSIRFLGGPAHRFRVVLGERFERLERFQQRGGPTLVLDFKAAAFEARGDVPPRPRRPVAEPALPIVVIDPGHGGAEVGAKGPGGTFEKDVTLAIARQLRWALVNHLGLRVFLTRDGDVELDLDDRAAIANNYKADMFLSIHANASPRGRAFGSEVYFLSYQATDDESRRLALAEGGLADLQDPAEPGSALEMILWDMAQAEHLEESSALASKLQDEMAELTGAEKRGVKQAPFRVLVGAGMPAALVEVAFISNPDEEKLLISGAHQARLAAALMRGVSRYLAERGPRSDATAAAGSTR